MQKFFVPQKGLIVRHPTTFNTVPEQGELVDWNGSNGRYWRRRVSCGDGSIQDKAPEKEIIARTTQPKKKRKEAIND